MYTSLRLHGLQLARLPCLSLSPGVWSDSCPFSQWCYLTISSSAHHLLLLPSIFPIIGIFSNESTLCIRWPKYWNFIFTVSLSNEYSGLVSFRIDCPYSPRGSQESYPAPQFKSISSLSFILLYGSSLTSIHD